MAENQLDHLLIDPTPGTSAAEQPTNEAPTAESGASTEENKESAGAEGAKPAPKMMPPEAKKKLYEVIKALSAMRLVKEDCTPNAILARRKNNGGGA